ncbi:MAG: ATP-dependent DNA helicase, partial [Haloarculaceae archaeon]
DGAGEDGAGEDGAGEDGAEEDGAESSEWTGDGGPGSDPGPGHDLGDAWGQYFGFDEPYANQGDAVDAAIGMGRANGYLAMEGPCGTGKTMAALTAAATLVRATDQYDNVVVVTPVKQQLQQFVDDLRTMNAGLAAAQESAIEALAAAEDGPEDPGPDDVDNPDPDDVDVPDPLTGIALVGKHDLCPYGREGVFPAGTSTHDRCEDLREHTADLVESEGRSGGGEAVASTAVAGETAEEDVWWDPQRGSDLAKHARPNAAAAGAGRQAGLAEDVLETAGAASPYRPEQPAAPASMAGEGGDAPLYCPFEADWYARNKGSPVGFGVGAHGVVTAEDYLPAAVERGTCPHRVMTTLLGDAEVVVANYNHLFDPDARPLLAGVLDERTFVIVDEAHRLEERVRDLLSKRVGRATLKRARNDCATILSRARESDEHETDVRDVLAAREVPLEAVEAAREFYADLLEWVDDRIARELDAEFGRGWRHGEFDAHPDRPLEIPLRDPDTVEQDELTAWAEEAGYTGDRWRSLAQVGAAVEDVVDDLAIARDPVATAVGITLEHWWTQDHATYLREIELEYGEADPRHVDRPWGAHYTAGLVLFECMPGEALREVFETLGGGVLMSATLEPLDVFAEVAGLEALRAGGRPVLERAYDLPFPEANRASWIVDAEPFTAHNRGDPAENEDPETWNPTRDQYAQVLRAVARSPGNVMIAMPNYREARWAGEYLRTVVEKPVLIDESSSNDETEALKRRFFRGDGKVLVTSTRGTLTEGVDYDGEKLACSAVVGVPLVNIGSPRITAVRRAYADAFGEDRAFEYALTVPAVRRARQAIGRVVRGTEEVGVRVFVGRRYAPRARHSVYGYLSPAEREEFVRMTPDFLGDQFDRFWTRHEGARPGTGGE